MEVSTPNWQCGWQSAPTETTYAKPPSYYMTLKVRVEDRISQRLGNRIHQLEVIVDQQSVELRGKCATHYSKQLAQHAALGVIEDEMLVNSIEVGRLPSLSARHLSNPADLAI
ncbi:MAG: hypothetical protein KDA37_13310 [Planctomycetales bacterium]|nr:hypothetical protein [Planctomycetales bacterium]